MAVVGRHLDHDKVLRRSGKKIEEGPPRCLGLRLVQSLEDHVKQQCVIGPKGDRLAPVGIEEHLVIEAHERANQIPERGIRIGLDEALDRAEESREFVGRERYFGDDAEATAATTLECPEKIGIAAGVAISTLPAAVTTSASSKLAAAIP